MYFLGSVMFLFFMLYVFRNIFITIIYYQFNYNVPIYIQIKALPSPIGVDKKKKQLLYSHSPISSCKHLECKYDIFLLL